MSIMLAQQKGRQVYVYNEKNQPIWYADGELQNFTSETVIIKKGSQLFIYNEKHQLIATKSC